MNKSNNSSIKASIDNSPLIQEETKKASSGSGGTVAPEMYLSAEEGRNERTQSVALDDDARV
jgi:hypothetical protein